MSPNGLCAALSPSAGPGREMDNNTERDEDNKHPVGPNKKENVYLPIWEYVSAYKVIVTHLVWFENWQ